MKEHTKSPIAQASETSEFIELANQNLRRWQETKQLGMRLHQKPLTDFMVRTVEEKRQALIEWWLDFCPFSPIFIEGDQYTWPFSPKTSVEKRAKIVLQYEAYLDSLRGDFGLGQKDMQELVQERRNALQEAIACSSCRSLADILGPPGFERYKSSALNEPTLERNRKNYEQLEKERSFPVILLYSLFNNPPAVLQRSATHSRQDDFLTDKATSSLSPREQTFLHWLEDSARNADEGWLTIDRINHLNKAMSSQRRVFQPRNYQRVESESVRALLAKVRKHPDYAEAIETASGRGKAWRLKSWQDYRIK